MAFLSGLCFWNVFSLLIACIHVERIAFILSFAIVKSAESASIILVMQWCSSPPEQADEVSRTTFEIVLCTNILALICL